MNKDKMNNENVLKAWEDLIYSSFISLKNLTNNNTAYIKLLDILIFICALSENLRLEIVKLGVSYSTYKSRLIFISFLFHLGHSSNHVKAEG